MASVLAIISKGIFEQMTRGTTPRPGAVIPVDRYTSTNPRLDQLKSGGSMFLVTVRPPKEDLWLVGVLESPRFANGVWTSAPNTLPITDLGPVRAQLVFDTGSGIQAKPGALGMSLQTPRTLTAADEALLRAAAGGPTPGASQQGPRARRPATLRERPERRPIDDGLLALLARDYWRLLGPERQARALRHALGRLGDAFRVVRNHAFGGASVPAILHAPTGVLFHLVPGGRCTVGATDAELAAVRAKLAGRADRDAAEELLDQLAGRPPRDVEVAPFLLAARPLDAAQVDALLAHGGGGGGDAHAKLHAELRRLGADAYARRITEAPPGAVPGDAVAKLEGALAAHGLRLPSEAEWEYAARGGDGVPFPWGADVPDAMGAGVNRFGLAWLGAASEVCADGFRPSLDGLAPDGSARRSSVASAARVVRGGAGTGAWRGPGEWVRALCFARDRQGNASAPLAVRPARSIERRAR